MIDREKLLLSDNEIWELMRPFVRSDVRSGGSKLAWRAKKRTLSFLRRALIPMNRTPRSVSRIYTKKWSNRSLEVLAPESKAKQIVWNDQRILTNPKVIKRVHIAQLIRIISHLRPKTVLEIGCGQGIILSILSRVFPDIEFAGLEFTHVGAQWARRLGTEPLPLPIKTFSPVEVPEDPPTVAPQIVCASAALLPFQQNAFDMIYSVQALEQMESIRPLVLAEISRTARSHVCMFEAFADWNRSWRTSTHMKIKRYWKGSLSDLRPKGLEPILQRSDLPHKLSMTVGCVVCEVRSDR